jgi:hypothetical protein
MNQIHSFCFGPYNGNGQLVPSSSHSDLTRLQSVMKRDFWKVVLAFFFLRKTPCFF